MKIINFHYVFLNYQCSWMKIINFHYVFLLNYQCRWLKTIRFPCVFLKLSIWMNQNHTVSLCFLTIINVVDSQPYVFIVKFKKRPAKYMSTTISQCEPESLRVPIGSFLNRILSKINHSEPGSLIPPNGPFLN